MLEEIAAPDDAHVPLSSQIRDGRVPSSATGDVVLNRERVRTRVNDFARIKSRERIPRRVAHVVQTALQRAHLQFFQTSQNLRSVLQLHPTKLNVLSRRDVAASIVTVFLDHAREISRLRRVQEPVRKLESHHVSSVVSLASVKQSRPLWSLIRLVRIVQRFIPRLEILRARLRHGLDLVQSDQRAHGILGELELLKRIRRFSPLLLDDVIPIRVSLHVRVLAFRFGKFRVSLDRRLVVRHEIGLVVHFPSKRPARAFLALRRAVFRRFRHRASPPSSSRAPRRPHRRSTARDRHRRHRIRRRHRRLRRRDDDDESR